MIINITVKQFPDEILKTIEESHEDIKNLVLNFFDESNLAINEHNLKKFVDTLQTIYHKANKSTKGIIRFYIPSAVFDPDIKFPLTLETIKTLLSNISFVNMLDDETFKKLSIISEKVTDFVLERKELRKHLDNIEPNVDSQTYENSCTARCIMKLLLELDYIKKSDYVRSKELEIHRGIWFKAGDFPTPETIVYYLSLYDMNITGISVNPFVKKILDNAEKSEEKNVDRVWIAMYSLFKKALQKHKDFDITALKEIDFPENMTTLLVMQPHDLMMLPHIIFGKKKDGKFETIDSYNGDKKTYPSVVAFMQESEFAGVYFDVSKRSPLSEAKMKSLT